LGLSNILEGEVSPEEAMRQDYPNLHTITSGTKSGNPVELLGSAQMGALLDTLVAEHDVVLLDTPTFLTVADAAVLTSFADGVLLVVKRGTSRQETLLETCYQLANLNAKSAGIIVNYAERKIRRLSYRGYVTTPPPRAIHAPQAGQTTARRVQVGRDAQALRSVQARSAWPPPQIDPILAPEKPSQFDELSVGAPDRDAK
jgi:Mrp family chromosome partitioning ATPase